MPPLAPRGPLASLALFLVGCGLSSERYYAELTEAQCEAVFACDPESAIALFVDEQACEESYEDYYADYADSYEGCTYSSEDGRACLDALRDLPCDAQDTDYVALEAACDAVWRC